uniref:YkgJ family cysteine cluster protein n=1 Tax=Fundidesulfovibrio putealis TaxID=270496 RepID=A0A7C4AFZ9_9BACT
MNGPYGDEKLTDSWIAALIKAQAVMDSGVRISLRQESLLRGQDPACSPGCDGCCRGQRVQATDVELAGALWQLGNVAPEDAQTVRQRLSGGGADACPFLLRGQCAVYPMRFLSCRQLVVFGRACAAGEDPARTRRQDALTLLAGHAMRAYSLLLPHLGVVDAPADPWDFQETLAGLMRPVCGLGVQDPQAFARALNLRGARARQAA